MRTAAIVCISWGLLLLQVEPGAAQNDGDRPSFRFDAMSLRSSLDSLMKWYPVSIVYLDADVDGIVVSAACATCDIEGAMNMVLGRTSLMWIRMGNQFLLKQRPVRQPRPTAFLSGTLTDSLTGIGIPDAIVMVYDSSDRSYSTVQRWCPTNAFGYFCLRSLSAGAYTVVVRALGYRSTHATVFIKGSESIRYDASLIQQEIALHEVTVEGERSSSIPAEGFARGLYIRATPADQTQYFLDGARIYNPSHFGGVLDSFNPEALNDVDESVGGLPPSYGGRIGGILDLSMREGSRAGLTGSVGTGSFGTQLSAEGPAAEGTTVLVSGRRGYPDALVPFLKSYGTPGRLGSSELTAKVSHRLSSSNRVFLSMYLGQDSYTNSVTGVGVHLSNNLSWGNGSANLRWIDIVSPSLFVHASAVFTRYDFQLEHLFESVGPPISNIPLGSDYSIEDLSIRAHAEHYYDEDHTVRGGVELIKHNVTGRISAFSSQVAPMAISGSTSWEISVYLQDQWKILPRMTAELGARATTFTGSEGTFSAVDPRLSLLYASDDDTRWYASLSSINQYLHPYRNSGVFYFFPPIFWYPSSEKVKPTTALQASMGLQKSLDNQTYLISAEGYYRATYNAHEWGTGTAYNPNGDMRDQVLLGSGTSYGVDLSIRKRTGDLTGNIHYTLSWARNTFSGLNGGLSFPSRFDRRHEVQIAATYAPGERWELGATCALASEPPSPIEPQVVANDFRLPGSVGNTQLPVSVGEFRGYTNLNGSRLPGFQRLELHVLRRFSLGGFSCHISLRLMNAYGLLDPFEWELRNASDLRFAWRAKLQDLKLFPLFPAVWMSVRF